MTKRVSSPPHSPSSTSASTPAPDRPTARQHCDVAEHGDDERQVNLEAVLLARAPRRRRRRRRRRARADGRRRRPPRRRAAWRTRRRSARRRRRRARRGPVRRGSPGARVPCRAPASVRGRGDRTRVLVAGVRSDDRLRRRRSHRRSRDRPPRGRATPARRSRNRSQAGRRRDRSVRPPLARADARSSSPSRATPGSRRAPHVPGGPSKRPGIWVPQYRQRPSSVRW